jgi:hypothetical protein
MGKFSKHDTVQGEGLEGIPPNSNPVISRGIQLKVE